MDMANNRFEEYELNIHVGWEYAKSNWLALVAKRCICIFPFYFPFFFFYVSNEIKRSGIFIFYEQIFISWNSSVKIEDTEEKIVQSDMYGRSRSEI